jgi:hypothetical protein
MTEKNPIFAINRRDFIRAGFGGALALQFGAGAFARALPGRPRARAVIEVWMWGGPSQIDTFDPKPGAGRDYTGPLADALETNVPGIRVNAALPKLAQQANKYSIIRSMTHGIKAHETATYMVQTGRAAGGGEVYPCVGAVVSRHLGHENGYQGVIPPYVVLTRSHGRFSEEGFLGARYKPFATGGDPSKDPFVVEGIIAAGISDRRQLARRELLHQLDTLGAQVPGNAQFAMTDDNEAAAYDLILGEAREIFDLGQESDATREAYGMNAFGQSCLQARRLVENGVPYITINYDGWDTHKSHFNIMNQKLPQFDQGLATLLEDLSARGLLDETIVWCSGEFGRTPRIQWKEPWNGGRGHFGDCFSGLVAGGGFRGGQVVGSTNATAEEVVNRPVYPRDLIGSIYELVGIDPNGTILNGAGIPVPLTLPSPGEGRLHEIMRT